MPIYLDHSATTPLRAEVLEAMMPFLGDSFGNAGSIHAYGRAARKAVEDAREQVAGLIHADPREVFFTSGGTEANNWVISSIPRCAASTRPSLVTTTIEHHSILHPAERFRTEQKGEVRLISVDSACRVSPEAIASRLDSSTVLVTVMHANNETGVIQPIEEIAGICSAHGVPFHTDAIQSVGKIPLDLRAVPLTFASLSAHKLYGPKGIGALFVRRGAELPPFMVGGFQERERRAGTENVPGIVGFGHACALAARERDEDAIRIAALRDYLERELCRLIRGLTIHGGGAARLPGLLNVGFGSIEGESMILGLDVAGIAVSSGSACTAGSLDPSHVLLAMGVDYTSAQSAVRFSLGRYTTRDEIDLVVDAVEQLVHRLRTPDRNQ